MGERGIRIDFKFVGLSKWKVGDSYYLRWVGEGGKLWRYLGIGIRICEV